MDFYSYLNGIYPILMVLDGFGWFWLLLGGFEIPHIVFLPKNRGAGLVYGCEILRHQTDGWNPNKIMGCLPAINWCRISISSYYLAGGLEPATNSFLMGFNRDLYKTIINSISYLVGGLEHEFYFFHSVGNVIIPIDELHHFSEGLVNHQLEGIP